MGTPFKMKGFSGFTSNSPLHQEGLPRLGLQKLPVKSSTYKPTKTSNPANWKADMAVSASKKHLDIQELTLQRQGQKW